MNKTQVLADLKAGRAAIELHGLCKGDIGSVEVGFCAYGAVRYVTSEATARIEPAIAALQHALIARTGDGMVSVYNDAYSTTKADVLALFDDAIRWTEAQA
ncbi:DUF6197 family protein [Nocardia gipuzkoensis]